MPNGGHHVNIPVSEQVKALEDEIDRLRKENQELKQNNNHLVEQLDAVKTTVKLLKSDGD